MQSASSLFRKFATDNVGQSFRRPKPKSEGAQKAASIFSKYAKGSYSSDEKEEETKTETVEEQKEGNLIQYQLFSKVKPKHTGLFSKYSFHPETFRAQRVA